MFALLSAFVITCTLDLDYTFQQGGASPWLNPSERWSGSSEILPVIQIFLSIQHNFCPFEFHPLQSLTKASDSTILLNSCCLATESLLTSLLVSPMYNLLRLVQVIQGMTYIMFSISQVILLGRYVLHS